jgi:hypothetical protein
MILAREGINYRICNHLQNLNRRHGQFANQIYSHNNNQRHRHAIITSDAVVIPFSGSKLLPKECACTSRHDDKSYIQNDCQWYRQHICNGEKYYAIKTQIDDTVNAFDRR